ncbi:uncharacterized protein LOC110847762 isoform X1 [Folsomia candida]|uniref:uncharacterized protein LOC110847762 isoform X1 n=1 Tax=Folsomia candida TaxID=158441 RepID=UPI0016052F53|nr:uncharacterized protein LOC110847762 isoform X1 [Folsomia candida]
MTSSEIDDKFLRLIQATPYLYQLWDQLRNEGFEIGSEAEINRAGTTFQRFRRLYDNLLQNRYKFDSSQWEKLQLIFQLTCNTAGFELLQKYFGDESEKEIYNPSINEFFVSPDDLSMPFNNSSVKQALFKSARNGNVIKMREMLASILQIFSSQGDEEEMVQKFGNFLLRTQDKVGKCILHAAVDGNCIECIEQVLEYSHQVGVKGKMLDSQTIFDETGLLIAIKKGYLSVARKLIIEGANIFIQNRIGHYPLQQIYQLYPTFATFLLDTSISVTSGGGAFVLSLNIDMSLFTNAVLKFKVNSNNWVRRVTDYSLVPNKPCTKSGTASVEENDTMNPEMYILAQLVYLKGKDCKTIVEHPVTEIFVGIKWVMLKHRIHLIKTYIPLAKYLVYFYLMYNFYVVDENEENENVASTTSSSNYLGFGLVPIFILLLITSISMRLLLVHFVKELCASPSNENRTWRCTPFGRVTQVSFTVVSLVTVLLPICAEKEKAQFYGNPLAVVGLLLSAFLLLGVIAESNLNHGVKSIYIYVYYKVAKRFISVLCTFLPLLIAFVLAFQIIFGKNSEFSGFWRTLFRLVIMLQGEFEYENGTRFDFGGNISQTKVWCGRILFAVLSCFLAILLIDVFLGYTICDVEVRKIFCTIYGKYLGLCNQIKQLYFTEKVLEMLRKTRWIGKLAILQNWISLDSINVIKSKNKLQFRNEVLVNWTNLDKSQRNKLHKLIFS